MVDVGTQKGTIDREEKELIQNVFEFDDLNAGEIATHRRELTILWQEDSVETWAATIHNSRHTRYPVCGASPDDVVGILNAKDYFRLEDRSKENVLARAVEPAYFVPETVKADVLFRNMKQSCHPLAVVLDEYGGMTGIVTISDLVEQLVGDLQEDAACAIPQPPVEAQPDGSWKIRGDAPLTQVARALGITLPCDAFDTFNGLVFDALAAIPRDGSTVELETAGLQIRVTKIRDHQVESALVRLQDPPPAGAEA